MIHNMRVTLYLAQPCLLYWKLCPKGASNVTPTFIMSAGGGGGPGMEKPLSEYPLFVLAGKDILLDWRVG